MTGENVTEQADARLNAMVATQDGFALAELDLQQRGPASSSAPARPAARVPRRQPAARPRHAGAGKVEAERFAARPDPAVPPAQIAAVWAASNSNGSAATASSKHRSSRAVALACSFVCHSTAN